ncbi:MAG TPA: DUF3108 domain-containing protein [Gemmatimonadaceae bacterium]|nr:DUF3108 domain-containing protein [Gemmatimonadaceae bacterium]
MQPSRVNRRIVRSVHCGLVLAASIFSARAAAALQGPPPPERLPFAVGEALEYSVHVTVGGTVGAGQMRVEGPVVERDVSTWRLVFDMRAARGPIRAVDRTVSWLDPRRFRITRFEKTERHPLSRSEEKVAIDQVAGTWRDEVTERSQPLGSPAPLDELSFIYFLRTLPLDRDTTFEVSRHFDPARNPTVIRVLGEELVETPVGIFRTRIVEMDVRDPKRYRGAGTVRLNIDTADCRVPVRIVSRMPVLGTTTLLLTGWASPPRYPGAMPCGA